MSYTRSKRIRRDDIMKVSNEIIHNAQKILNKDTMEDINTFIQLSEDFGEMCAHYRHRGKVISTSQIRGIFNEVKKLSDNFEASKKDLNLLRPKLAYQKGRFEVLEPLTNILIELIKKVNDNKTLQGFKEFFEAIIAYHKASGGD